jgi:hypothetical protein
MTAREKKAVEMTREIRRNSKAMELTDNQIMATASYRVVYSGLNWQAEQCALYATLTITGQFSADIDEDSIRDAGMEKVV